MNVSLIPDSHEIVQKKVKSGLYSNASEVIRDSMRKLDKEEKKETAWFALNEMLTNASNSGKSDKTSNDIVEKVISKNE
jgi:putative addiction module CopG family antidote